MADVFNTINGVPWQRSFNHMFSKNYAQCTTFSPCDEYTSGASKYLTYVKEIEEAQVTLAKSREVVSQECTGEIHQLDTPIDDYDLSQCLKNKTVEECVFVRTQTGIHDEQSESESSSRGRANELSQIEKDASVLTSNLNSMLKMSTPDINTLLAAFRALCRHVKPVNLITSIAHIVYAPNLKIVTSEVYKIAELYDVTYNTLSDHVAWAKFFWMQANFAWKLLSKLLKDTDTTPPEGIPDSESIKSFIDKISEQGDPPLKQSLGTIDEERCLVVKEMLTRIGLPNVSKLIEPMGVIVSLLVSGAIGLYVLITGKKAGFDEQTVVQLLSQAGFHSRNLNWLKKGLVDTFVAVRQFFYSLFGMEYVSPARGRGQDLIDKATLLLKQTGNFLVRFKHDPTILVFERSAWREMCASIKDCEALFADIALTNTPMGNCKALIDELKEHLHELKSFERDILSISSVKFDPITIWLYGEPGVGKSQFQKYLVKRISERMGRNLTTYYRSVADDFASGYEGQDVYAYDEFGTRTDGLDVAEWASITTEAATRMNMASLEDKGKAFSSTLCMICSNNKHITRCAPLQLIGNLPRRVFRLLEVKNPAFNDYVVKNKTVPGAGSKIWKEDYSHIRLVSHSPFPEFDTEANRKPETIDSVIDDLLVEYTARLVKFKKAISEEWAVIQAKRGVLPPPLPVAEPSTSAQGLVDPVIPQAQKQVAVLGILGVSGIGKTNLMTQIYQELGKYQVVYIHVNEIHQLTDVLKGHKKPKDCRNATLKLMRTDRSTVIFVDDITTSRNFFEEFREFMMYVTTGTDSRIKGLVFTANDDLFDSYHSNEAQRTEFQRRMVAIELRFKKKNPFSRWTCKDMYNAEPAEYEKFVDIMTRSKDGIVQILRSSIVRTFLRHIEIKDLGVDTPSKKVFSEIEDFKANLEISITADYKTFQSFLKNVTSFSNLLALRDIAYVPPLQLLEHGPLLATLFKEFRKYKFDVADDYVTFFEDLQNARLQAPFDTTISIETVEGIFYLSSVSSSEVKYKVLDIGFRPSGKSVVVQLDPVEAGEKHRMKFSWTVTEAAMKADKLSALLVKEIIKQEAMKSIPAWCESLMDLVLLIAQFSVAGFSIHTLIKRAAFTKFSWSFAENLPGAKDFVEDKFESAAPVVFKCDESVVPDVDVFEGFYKSHKGDFQRVGNRDVAYYGMYPYNYGTVEHAPKDLPKLIEGIRTYLQIRCARDWNGVVINRFTGNWTMPMHKDDEVGITPDIVDLSVGAEAFLQVKGIGLFPLKDRMAVMFTDGTLNRHTHGAKGRGLRYSLSFRVHEDVKTENADPNVIDMLANVAPRPVNVPAMSAIENADVGVLDANVIAAPRPVNVPAMSSIEGVKIIPQPGKEELTKLVHLLKQGQTPLDIDVNVSEEPEVKQFDFNALSTPVVKGVIKEALLDQGAKDVMGAVIRNYVQIVTPQQAFLNFGLMIADRYGCTIQHSEHQAIIPGTKKDITVMLFSGQVVTARLVARSDIRDLLIFKLDMAAPQFTSILKHLPKKDGRIPLEGKTALFPVLTMQKFGPSKYTCFVSRMRLQKYLPLEEGVPGCGQSYIGNYPSISERVCVGTSPGDCGAALILDGNSIKYRLIGIHKAASSVDGYCADIFQDDFTPFLVQHQTAIPEMDVNVAAPARCDLVLFEKKFRIGNSLFVGRAYPENRQPGTTKIWKSPLGPPWIKIYHEPTVLLNNDTRLPPSFVDDIRMQAIRKWNVDPATEFDVDHSLNAMQSIIDYYVYKVKLVGKPLKVLTKTEAVNYCSDYLVSRAINRASSAGYPWSHWVKNAGKHDFFRMKSTELGSIHEIDMSSELGCSLNAAVDRLINDCRHERVPIVVFQTALKDEVRPIERVRETPKTRGFTPAPLDYVIAHRMYFHAAIAALREARYNAPVQVGIDPLSREWDSMMLSMLSFNTQAFDGDYGDFDAKHPSFVVMFPSVLYRTLYAVLDPNCTSLHDTTRDYIERASRHPYIQLTSELVQFPGGIFSGKPSTTDDNSYINLFYLYYSWRVLCVEHHQEKLITFEHFQRKVGCIIFGDDNEVHPMKDVISWYNLQTVSEVLKRDFNVVLKSSEKEDVLIPSRHYKSCKFLKRYHRRVGDRIMGVFGEETFSKMLHWTIADKRHVYCQDENVVRYDVNTMKMTCLAALREAAPCGGPFFRRLRGWLQNVLDRIGAEFYLPPLEYFCTELEISLHAVENLVHEELPLSVDGKLFCYE
ncbi:hypothetical protein 1 [Hubei picorna-like virus 73]|uniref:hypothetical protein 1 n=1 Tax=Hubei picorna-like virus 73 TaxID=1923157 RepID=UPI00090A7A10|nr:hypothetical protein 1 [Hubei picorna-like virus 73]APG77513.1 hypothetical protein 1 [Hubei picorna-like virus 73]